MPVRAPSKPKRKNKPGAGRPLVDFTRDVMIPPLRTFGEVRDRLDALVLLRNHASRGRLMEYYLLRGMEADERDLEITAEDLERVLEKLPSVIERLEPKVRNQVIKLYRHAAMLTRQRAVGRGAKKATPRRVRASA